MRGVRVGGGRSDFGSWKGRYGLYVKARMCRRAKSLEKCYTIVCEREVESIHHLKGFEERSNSDVYVVRCHIFCLLIIMSLCQIYGFQGHTSLTTPNMLRTERNVACQKVRKTRWHKYRNWSTSHRSHSPTALIAKSLSSGLCLARSFDTDT